MEIIVLRREKGSERTVRLKGGGVTLVHINQCGCKLSFDRAS